MLTRQLVDGKKKLAILYGAAHMPDSTAGDELGLGEGPPPPPHNALVAPTKLPAQRQAS